MKNSEIEKGCYKYFFILAGAAAILSMFAYFFQRWQRHHLFCEEIKTGMSESEVLSIMDRFGEFEIFKFDVFDSDEGTFEFGSPKYDNTDNGEGTMVLVQPMNNYKTSIMYGSRGIELYFKKDSLYGVIERYHLEDGVYELCKK